MLWRSYLEDREAKEGRELFCGEKTEKRGRVQQYLESTGKSLTMKVAGEKEKEWKHSRWTKQEICSQKPLTGRNERVSIPLGLYKQGSADSEILELNSWWYSGGEEG